MDHFPWIRSGRPVTPDQKRAIVERVLVAWQRVPFQRLGQLIDNAMRGPDGAQPCDLSDVEDDDLAELVEAFAARMPE